MFHMHRKFFHMHMQIFMGGRYKGTFPHEPFYLHLRKNFEKNLVNTDGITNFLPKQDFSFHYNCFSHLKFFHLNYQFLKAFLSSNFCDYKSVITAKFLIFFFHVAEGRFCSFLLVFQETLLIFKRSLGITIYIGFTDFEPFKKF